jgi:predicted Zn-dependent peptidase
MMGRIGDSVRERSGLAYYASTSLNAFTDGGSWDVAAGVNPANLQRAIDLILEELRRFTTEAVSRKNCKITSQLHRPLAAEMNPTPCSRLAVEYRTLRPGVGLLPALSR